LGASRNLEETEEEQLLKARKKETQCGRNCSQNAQDEKDTGNLPESSFPRPHWHLMLHNTTTRIFFTMAVPDFAFEELHRCFHCLPIYTRSLGFIAMKDYYRGTG
jgi:hypothetical protein